MKIEDAALIFADGSIFYGKSVGVKGVVVGEVCFTTSMLGYQESITDPSYSGQIITFSSPHIGAIGANKFDVENHIPLTKCIVCRDFSFDYSPDRSELSLLEFLIQHGVLCIFNIDTRALVIKLREEGFQNAVACAGNAALEANEIKHLQSQAKFYKPMKMFDFFSNFSNYFEYSEANLLESFESKKSPLCKVALSSIVNHAQDKRVAVINYGVKYNILRILERLGFDVYLFAPDVKFEEISCFDAVVLSNGPGDPIEVYEYSKQCIDALVKSKIPVFGICMGHQILCLALGGKTIKMEKGHRGTNSPVLDIKKNKTILTTQNHGFVVTDNFSNPGVIVSYRSLFDNTIEGIEYDNERIVSVQFHPEGAPGPRDAFNILADFFKKHFL